MPKGVMWRHEDIYLSAVGGSGNPALGVAPVADLDDVAARAGGGYPLAGSLTLCPLMHGGGWWVGFNALLSGATHVLIRDLGFDPGFALRVMAEERVSVIMTIGDAYARPIVDFLEAHGDHGLDLSTLLVYGSGGAILSPSVKDSLATLLPNVLVLDAFGASETGGQGALIGQSDDGAPVFAMDPSNVVIAEDGSLCTPGDGRMGMLATSGHIPLRYHKDEAKTAATFPVVDGVRYAVPGDMARVLADGTIAVYGRGSVSINSGRREGLPRGGGEGPQVPSGGVRRHRGRHPERTVGLPGDRRRAAAAPGWRPRPTPDDLRDHVPHPPGRLQAPPGRRVRGHASGAPRPANPTTAGRRTWPWPRSRARSRRGRERSPDPG